MSDFERLRYGVSLAQNLEREDLDKENLERERVLREREREKEREMVTLSCEGSWT